MTAWPRARQPSWPPPVGGSRTVTWPSLICRFPSFSPLQCCSRSRQRAGNRTAPPRLLFTPVLFFDRRNWKRWFASWPILVFAAVALPWHVVATFRNGWNLLYVLFIEQQFGRFLNASRQHGQPLWFYLPVFLGLLFPWFALLPLAFRKKSADYRLRTLMTILVLGLIFFSASINMPPGSVLPLAPATCILMGAGLAAAPRPERWLIAPIILLGAMSHR